MHQPDIQGMYYPPCFFYYIHDCNCTGLAHTDGNDIKRIASLRNRFLRKFIPEQDEKLFQAFSKPADRTSLLKEEFLKKEKGRNPHLSRMRPLSYLSNS